LGDLFCFWRLSSSLKYSLEFCKRVTNRSMSSKQWFNICTSRSILAAVMLPLSPLGWLEEPRATRFKLRPFELLLSSTLL
jgi:hypothetical protein